MPHSSSIPKVVIVGRPNVGKSSLFNMLAGRRVSIVDPTPGVTRDRISIMTSIPSDHHANGAQPIELVDTGGHGIQDTQNLTAEVEQQISFAVKAATLILFVVDAQYGLTSLDESVAQLLRRSGRTGTTPILLVANKVDGREHEWGAGEAARIGFGEPILVSATSGYRKHDLWKAIDQLIDRSDTVHRPDRQETAVDAAVPSALPGTGVLIAIVGKRNVGKSTLVNALAGEPRVIVSEIEGTTRDAVDVRFEMDGHVFTAIDTAGVRRRRSLNDDIDFYSYHRALRSMRRADVVLFLIDATVPVSQVDQQLSQELLEHCKPTVIVINKWDLAEAQHTTDEYADYLNAVLKGFSFAPIAFISADRVDGVREVVAMAMNLYRQAGHRVTTAAINQVMLQIVRRHGPASKSGRRLKIYYVSQVAKRPPTVGLWVNHPDLFDQSYQRFVLNRLRDLMPWSEVPIKMVIRGKKCLPPQRHMESARHEGIKVPRRNRGNLRHKG